jgi:hypothetical protein
VGQQVSRKPTVADVVAEQKRGPKGAEQDAKLIESLTAEVTRLRKHRAPKPIKVRKGKAAKHIVRVVIPDTHGNHIDPVARDVFLSDLAQIKPDEIVGLGDHLDCAGTFSTHQRSYTNELAESFSDDVDATNDFFDACQSAAPNARWDVLEGNHCAHVERWVSRNFTSHKDAKMVVDMLGPTGVLRMHQRGFRYIKRSEFYDNLAIPGAIQKGRVFFVHGVSHAKHAAAVHLERFSANVVFGHVHRSMSIVSRTVTSTGFGAWCPGTLAKLQPLYLHTHPSGWSHGYGLELVNESTGTFLHLNVPIVGGASMLRELTALGARHA